MTARIKSFTGSMVMSATLIALAAPVASAQEPVAAAPAATLAAADQSVSSHTAFFSTAFATALNGRQEVWITLSDGSQMKGRVTAVAPTGLTVTGISGQGQTVPFGDITKIQKVSTRLRKNTLVGLGVGLGLGAYGALFCGQARSGCQAPLIATYASVGAGIGALTGAIKNALHRDEDIVYDAARRTKTVALTPIVSRTRKGAAMSITWR